MADPYQALYRRYRSKRFSEQRGQDHVMRALSTAVQEGRVGHAYLFSGPRGTGKTSTARILAKVLNCERPVGGEPCCECDNCLAIDEGRIVDWLLELDAATNSRVDDMRSLIERIPLGTSGNRKVVILDEVHMLSAGASNALLKSLEEPPAHVVFILATTDPQKVLPTIRSRTQHFEFHLLPAEELADHVRHVIADAGLDLGEEAVEHVVRQGGGSARDTLSALDQVAAMGGVLVEAEPVEAIVDALAEHDAGAALVAVAAATAAGRDPRVLGEVLIARLRHAFLAVMGAPDKHLPPGDLERAEALGAALGAAGLTRALEVLGDALVELARKPDPRIVLEVALVRLCRADADRSLDAIVDRLERLERALAAGATGAPGASALPASPASPAAPAGPRAAAPEPASGPGRPDAAPPADGGPAAEARAQLAQARAAAPGRPRQPVRKATAAAPAPTSSALPEAVPASAGDPPSHDASPGSAAEGGSGSPGAAATASPAGPAPASGAVPSAAELTAAWSGEVLGALAKGTKAVFGTGRFVDADPSTAVFALTNAPTRDHCEKKRSEVEAALAQHFGRPVPLKLVTDAELGGPVPAGPSVGAAAGGHSSARELPDEVDIADVHDLEDAPTAATGVERLAEAFPGAELVEEP